MYREILQSELKLDKTLQYVYFLDREHPLSSIGVGRVYYHRHVASIYYNRWLTSDEIVHHIDENKQNNLPENLLVLSSTDHSLLHALERGGSPKVSITCPVCNTNFFAHYSTRNTRVHCSEKCANQAIVKWHISKEELEILIWNMSYVDISKVHPISDVGAKKRAKSLGCKMPPAYFYNKTELFRKQQRALNNITDLPTQQSSKLLA